MRNLNSVFIFLLLNFLTIEIYGKVVWEEGFNVPDQGVWGDADGESLHVDLSSVDQWFINFDSCHFSAENDYVRTVSTSGGRFEALDCDGEAVWYSKWIDISKYSEISCGLIARETGSGSNVNKKYLRAYYQLNNQKEVLFETNGVNEGNWGVDTVSQANLQGDSLRIVVRLNSIYANDKVSFDDVRVWTDQPEIVDPFLFANTGDVLISEVLFNPYPGGVDFVELYNASDKSILLNHLFLANRDGDSALKTIVPLTREERFLQPKTYLVLSEDQEKVLVFYRTNCPDCFLDLADMPAYNNDQGDVVLLNDSLQVIDEMHYSSTMHHSLLVDKEGVSLERVSFDAPASDASNWASASAEVRFATPGFENSMSEDGFINRDKLILEPSCFSPNGDGYNDFLRIDYQFKNSNYVANLRIFDSHGIPVCDLVKNEPAGSRGEWIWTGKRDNGSNVRLGMYIVLLELYDGNGDVKKFKKVCTVTDQL